jgi:hypothetical protein
MDLIRRLIKDIPLHILARNRINERITKLQICYDQSKAEFFDLYRLNEACDDLKSQSVFKTVISNEFRKRRGLRTADALWLHCMPKIERHLRDICDTKHDKLHKYGKYCELKDELDEPNDGLADRVPVPSPTAGLSIATVKIR